MEKGTILKDTYEIMEEIGSGGGGIVYKARHIRLDIYVVVKKVRDEVLGKMESDQEVKILKNLKHSYLPRVYDFIDQPDGVYTVMDFIQGENLDEAVRRHGKYGQNQVMKWAGQLGEALAYLHGQNPPVIHSDIKPANVMLTKEGNICLIDFNISLAMGGSKSAVGISAGFSPPEQYQDPAIYARITHNYTPQESLSAAEATKNSGGETTLSGSLSVNGGETMLSNVAAANGDETVLSGAAANGDETALSSAAALNPEGTVKLWRQDDAASTAGSTLPKYTQLFGKGIDARSDIYSLGITLCFLLTGKAPSLDFGERAPIGKTGVEISEGFALILDKMTELSPDSRFQDGGEFLKALKGCYKLDHRYRVMHRTQTGMQLGALGCLAAGILLSFGGVYQMQKEENNAYYGYIQQAQEAMAAYDYGAADGLLAEAKELSQTRIDAYEKEVYLLYLSGEYEECISRGETYINAAPYLIESVEDEELLGDIYYVVGNAYFEQEDYPNARHLFENALEHNTKNGLYYRDYAITLAKLGQVQEAEVQLEQGIAIGLAQDSIYMAQGEIAHRKGQYPQAVEYLTQAIGTTDDMQMKKRAILLCVDVYKAIGNDAVDEEIALLEQYAGLFEGNGSLAMTEYLAEAYTRKAQTDETQAQACWKKALELFTSIYEKGYVTYQIQENMAILYENLDDFDEAESLLMEIAESYPQRYEVYKRLAYLEADRQQMKENEDRDYAQMRAYYEKAKDLYSGKEQDAEMDMLDGIMQDLEDGGWF